MEQTKGDADHDIEDRKAKQGPNEPDQDKQEHTEAGRAEHGTSDAGEFVSEETPIAGKRGGEKGGKLAHARGSAREFDADAEAVLDAGKKAGQNRQGSR